MKFLRSFGYGLLYILLLPLILVGIGLTAVYGVIFFFVEFVIMLINFFSGKKLFPPFEEDVKAQRLIQEQLDKKNTPPEPQQPQTVFIQQTYYQTPPGMGMPPQTGIPQAQPNPYQGQIPQTPYQGEIPQQPYQSQIPQQPYQAQIPQNGYEQPQTPTIDATPIENDSPYAPNLGSQEVESEPTVPLIENQEGGDEQ